MSFRTILRAIIFAAAMVMARPETAVAQDLLARTMSSAAQALDQGEFRLAERRFRSLLDLDQGDSGRTSVYRVGLSRAVNETGWTVTGRFAIRPSTNVRQETESLTFDTDLGTFIVVPSGEERSGIGVSAGATLRRELSFAPGQITGLEVRADGLWYEARDLQAGSIILRADHEWITSGRSLTLGIEIGETFFPDVAGRSDPGSRRIAMDIGGHIAPSWRDRLTARFTLAHHDFYERDYDDAVSGTVTLGARRLLANGMTAEVSLTGNRYDARLARRSYDRFAFGLDLSRTMDNGFAWRAEAAVDTRRHSAPYPALSAPRQDFGWQVGATVAHKAITTFGAMPTLGCRLRKQSSNVVFYEYDSFDCTIGLQKQF